MTEAEIGRLNACALAGTAYEVDEHAIVDAAEIRRVLCELLPRADGKPPSAAKRVHIQGTRKDDKATMIQGAMDLREVHGADGGPCPPLIMENCDLQGPAPGSEEEKQGFMSFRGGRGKFIRLWLSDLRLNELDLQGAAVEHEVIIQVRPLVSESRKYCVINASSIRVNGTFRVIESELDVRVQGDTPAVEKTVALPPSDVNVAAEAEVVQGSAGTEDAQEGGNAPDRADALPAEPEVEQEQGVEDDSEVPEEESATKDGGAAPTAEPELVAIHSLDLREAHVGGTVVLSGMKTVGGVNMTLARIEGDVNVDNCELANARPSDHAFIGQNMSVGGAVFVHGVTALGGITLVQARINSMLRMRDHPERRCVLTATGGHSALDLLLCEINGILSLGVNGTGAQSGHHLTLRGNMSAIGCKVTGTAELAVRIERSRRAGLSIVLHWLDVKGRLSVDVEQTLAKPLRVMKILGQKELSFYKGWELVEVKCRDDQDEADLFCSFLLRRKDGRAMELTGESAPIHDMNDQDWLDIRSSKKAFDYLRFFCAFVWGGKEGPFKVIEGEEDLDGSGLVFKLGRYGKDKARAMKDIKPLCELQGRAAVEHYVKEESAFWNNPTTTSEKLETVMRAYDAHVEPGARLISGTVLYGPAIFRALFLLFKNGSIEMLHDEPLIKMSGGDEEFDPARGRISKSKAELRPLLRGMRPWRAIDEKIAWFQEAMEPRTTVDLRNARVGLLDDEHGKRWGRHVFLRLDGFSYEHVAGRKAVDGALRLPSESGEERAARTGPAEVADRRKWLRKQYMSADRPAGREFVLQPYEQLATVLRAEGYDEEARKVVLDKLKQERKVRRLPVTAWKDIERILTKGRMWFMEFFFDHGLLLIKPLISTLGLFVLGCFFFWCAWSTGNLELAEGGGNPPKAAVEVSWQDVNVRVAGLGDHADRASERPPSFIWLALDKLVPVVDLSDSDKAYRLKDDASWMWGLLLFVYRLLGVVAIWVLIQHLSGGVKRYLDK